MGHGPVSPQVQVPLEGLRGQLMVLQACRQRPVVMNALPAPDDFAVSFRSQHVHAQRLVGIVGVGLHIKGLDLRGIPVHQDGFLKLIGQEGFIVRAEIIALLDRRPEALQAQNRFIIGESRKRRDDRFQFGHVSFQYL